MKTLPPYNLPDTAVPWARAVEEVVAEQDREISALLQQRNASNEVISTMTSQLQTLQNYVRKICELNGNPYPPSDAPPEQPPAAVVPPAPTSKTIEVGTGWSATWYQSFKRTSAGGTNDDRQSLYQRGTGYTFSMWGFPDILDAAGKNITSAEMLLTNISTYWNGSFTAFLGTHGSLGEPANRQGRENGWDVGWTAGEGKWVSIPKNLLGGISNGSIRGFTMGDSAADKQNFARFNGHGRGGSPRLRLTFQV